MIRLKNPRRLAGLTEAALAMLLGIATMMNLVTTFLDVCSRRHLMSAGADFAFGTLKKNWPYYDVDFTRYFNASLELPALLLSRLTRQSGELALYLDAVALTYWLFPWLGMAWAFWLLKRYRRQDLMVFVLLSFALVTQSVLPNPSALAGDNLVFLWPAVILAAFSRRFSRGCLAGISFILFCWSFSHETSIFCVCFVGLLLVLRIRVAPSPERARLVAAALLCATSFGWLVYRVVGPTHGDSQWFVANVLEPWGPFRLFSLAAILAWLFSFMLAIRKKNPSSWSVFALTCLGALWFSFRLYNTPGSIIYGDIVCARTTAIPFALAIAAMAWGAVFVAPQWHRSREGRTSPFLVLATALALVFSAGYDFDGNRHWLTAVGAIQTLLDKSTGCTDVGNTDPDWKVYQAESPIRTMVPLLSVLLAGNRSVSKVIFPRVTHRPERTSFCCALKSGDFAMYLGFLNINRVPYFDFAPVLATIEKSRLQCP